MLLKVRTRTVENETALELWEIGGKTALLRAPFNPYFFAPFDVGAGTRKVVEKTLLSTLQKRKLWKVSFPNTYKLKKCRVSGGIEDTIPYKQRVAIDLGFQFESDLPSHDAFDLEMESTKGTFPNAEYDRITAISYEGENYAECKTIFDEPEYELIAWFVDIIRKRDPDVPETYFGSFFDWLVLITRAKKLGIKLAVGRDSSEPYVITRTFKSGKKVGEDKIIDIRGRVHFDVWKEVAQDQTLFGIKNRKLKTVAKWFGIPVIEVDRSQMAKLNNEELRAYCQSDAHATRELAKIYLRNLFPLGEMLRIPLNMVVNRSPSHASNYIYMSEFKELGIVADKKNNERWPQFFVEGRKAYQGALVDLFAPGVYLEKDGLIIRHADFKSQYPTIMHCHNYSPESLLNVTLKSGQFADKMVRYDGNTIHINDSKIGTISVTVDLSHDSVSKRKIEEYMNWRDRIKAKLKKKYSEDLQSQQWAIKVIMNAMTGYHGMGFARCGSVPIVAHITGHGRYWIHNATEYLYANDANPIERDTDGIYYVGPDCTAGINQLILDRIPDQFDKKFVRVSQDLYPYGIFYGEKGYVLREKSGKLIFHGSGLKGRHIPKLCDKAVERIAVAIFEGEHIIDELNDIGRGLKQLSQEDFIMTAQLKKRPEDYSTKNQYGKLVERMKKYGIPLRWGDEIQYIKTKDRSYLPLGAPGQFNVDYNYYRGRIADVVERLLRVSHGYNRKDVVFYLKGGRTTQTRL